MDAQMAKAQELLFGKGGIQVSNIKLYPGTNREVDSETIAAQVASAVCNLVNGSDVEPVGDEELELAGDEQQ